MIGDPPITIRMWLTEEEISRIEDKLIEIGFFDEGYSPVPSKPVDVAGKALRMAEALQQLN